MQLGVLGGSFDPPHLAHVLLSRHVLENQGLDRLLWIPCFAHPLGKRLTPFEHRVAMCRLALKPLGERATVLDLEQNLPQPSYTINTLLRLAELHPQDQLRLVVGGDILSERHQWRDFDEIERLAPLVIVPRRGFESAEGEGAEADYPLPDIQSRLIRERLSRGEDVSELLPASVLDYLKEHGCYA